MRCTAKAKTTGEQCKSDALRGQTVCRMHGGSTGRSRRAAARNLAMARAQRMVQLAGIDQDPIEHLLDSLYRAAQQVHVWGIMIAALDDQAELEAEERGWIRGELAYSENTDPEQPGTELNVVSHDRLLALTSGGEAKVHPYLTEYNQALERRARFAKLCVDAGVAERQIEIAEQYAERLSSLFDQAIGAIEGLSAEQRMVAAATYARGLARLEAPVEGREATA